MTQKASSKRKTLSRVTTKTKSNPVQRRASDGVSAQGSQAALNQSRLQAQSKSKPKPKRSAAERKAAIAKNPKRQARIAEKKKAKVAAGTARKKPTVAKTAKKVVKKFGGSKATAKKVGSAVKKISTAIKSYKR